MRKTKGYRLSQIIAPLVSYLVAMNVALMVCVQIWGDSTEEYMMRQSVASVAAFCVLLPMYYRDSLCSQPWNTLKENWKIQGTKQSFRSIFLILATAIFSSLAWNNIICMTGLVEASKTYQAVSKAFFGGPFFWKIVGSGIVAPILEELLYRGILYNRVKSWYSKNVAMFFSAFIFAAMHMNLVQFLYAFVLGIVLILCMERTQHLYGAVLAHMAANLVAVCRTQFQWFLWFESNHTRYFVWTVVLTILSIESIWLLTREKKG